MTSNENMWIEAKELFGIPDTLLAKYENDKSMYYTKDICTFDFEARLPKIKKEEVIAGFSKISSMEDEDILEEEVEEEEPTEEGEKYKATDS